MTEKLRIAYLMESTDLSGGIRVIVAQADALIARGHEVTIVVRRGTLDWRRSSARWIHSPDFSVIDASAFDVVIGTFYTTVPDAYAIAGARAVHLCQGYEGSFTHYQGIKEQIDAAYRIPIPKIVVSPSLVEVCRQFTNDVVNIGQLLEDEFFRDPVERRPFPSRPRVLMVGASEIDFKGIPVGYAAIQHARSRGGEFDLVRVSPGPPRNDEPQTEAAEFHVELTTPQMVEMMHSCDLFLSSSRKEEGFGLPAAEAMASCLPAVLTRIPSYLAFAAEQDFALFADEDDARGLGEQLQRLLGDGELRARLARRGREVVEQYRAERVAERMERFFLERIAES